MMQPLSYMVSKWYPFFCRIGYPELDILQYDDGEWHVIQYFNAPIVPSLTRWQTILGPMRNVEIGYGFLEKYIKALDINQKEFWAREEAKTKAVEEEWERTQRHAEDMATRATAAFTRNPNVMERLARNGTNELNLQTLAKHVPKNAFKKYKYKGKRIKTIKASGETA